MRNNDSPSPQDPYRTLFEHSPLGQVILQDGRIVLANPAMGKITGYTLEELLKLSPKAIQAMIHPDDRPWVLERLAARLAGKPAPDRYKFRFMHRHGSLRWVEAAPIRIEYAGRPAILVTYTDVTERMRVEEAMRVLTRRLIFIQEEERKRIAQELHDELGQALTAISLDLGSIQKNLPPQTPEPIQERLAEARALADEIDERISEMALDMRPSLLDDLGLLPALRWYLNRFSQRLGIQVIFDRDDLAERLPQEVETALYRIIQESLTNVARHAQAGSVQVCLERQAECIVVSIQDDGVGFDLQKVQNMVFNTGGVGILGIEERTASLGGRLEILSSPGQGTRLQIEIPVPARSEA